tara:strand:- start:771 stop:947 length:177 start_codon:yes stop_codon:yes gene_type:complete
MSNEHNDRIKEDILDEVSEMTIDEFQNACEKHGLKTESSVLDEYVSALADKLFEARSQ